MKKIIWYSRFPATPRQEVELRRVYGPGATIVHRTISSAGDIVRDFFEEGASDCVFVGPLAVLEVILREGITPLWPDMAECPPDHVECEVRLPDGRCYRFVRYERVRELRLAYAPQLAALPEASGRILWLTQHELRSEAAAELRPLHGDRLAIVQQSARPDRLTAADIIRLMREHGCDDVALVAPLPVFDGLTQQGIQPLQIQWRHDPVMGCHRQTLHRVTGLVFRREPI